jgi:hypothetical protein
MTTRRTTIATIATIAAVAALAATGSAIAAVPAGAATPSATAASCDKAPWQARVQGTPANFGAGSPSGDYLWHNTHGFHLAVTHQRNDRRIYSGQITSSAPMRIDPVRLEKGDIARLSANHRTLVFVFANHGYIDGVNFHTDCASWLTVSRLHVGSRNLPARNVYLGHAKVHPAQVPFTVRRIPVPST